MKKTEVTLEVKMNETLSLRENVETNDVMMDDTPTMTLHSDNSVPDADVDDGASIEGKTDVMQQDGDESHADGNNNDVIAKNVSESIDGNVESTTAQDTMKDGENGVATVDQNINETTVDIDLTKPLKKGRTAYFIFQQEKRNEVMIELTNVPTADSDESNKGQKDTTTNTTKVSVAMVAKRVGELWSHLSADEKEVYQAKSRKEKEMYEKYCNALTKAGITPSSMMKSSSLSPTITSSKNDNDMVFPVSRIRKICRLDPEVKGMSKESTIMITKCCEFFVSKMAKETWSMAKMHQKRTIHAQDVLDTCSLKEMFFFLREDMKDLIHEQKEDKKRKRELKKNVGQIDSGCGENDDRQNKIVKGMNMTGVKPLTSYFAPKS